MEKKLSGLLAAVLVFCLLFSSSALAGTSVDAARNPVPEGDDALLQRLQEAPEFKFYHAKEGIGYGTCPVYSAPDINSFRTANGKACVSTNNDMYEAGYVAGWLLVRYGTNNGGTNVGYIPPKYIQGYKSHMGYPKFEYIPVTAADTIYVTNNPLLPGSYYATLDPEESFYILGKYTYHYDWWYIECTVDGKPARGFIDRESSVFSLGSDASSDSSSGSGNSVTSSSSAGTDLGNPALSPLGTSQNGTVKVNYGSNGQRKNVRQRPDPDSALVVAVSPGEVFPVYASQTGTTGKTWYYIFIERVSKWGWISEGVASYSH